MGLFDEFAEFATPDVPLAPLTWFRLGGPAAWMARPQTSDQLLAIVKRCRDASIPWRVLGGGSNILVPDQGVTSLVIHLESPAFSDIQIGQNSAKAGAAVPLTALCSQAARAGLAGLEVLTGIPGTIGGCLMSSDGDGRQNGLLERLRSVDVLDPSGEIRTLDADEVRFLADEEDEEEKPIVLSAEVQLAPEDPEAVVRRMRRIWILKKERQPYGHQSSGYIFKDPSPERSAATLIEQAGLRGQRTDHVEISDRNANFLIAHPGATSAEVQRMIETIREQIAREFRQELRLRIKIW